MISFVVPQDMNEPIHPEEKFEEDVMELLLAEAQEMNHQGEYVFTRDDLDLFIRQLWEHHYLPWLKKQERIDVDALTRALLATKGKASIQEQAEAIAALL